MMSCLWCPEMPFPATSPTAGCQVRTVVSDWWAAVVHLDTAIFLHLHIHHMDHEYWWAGCGRSGCPVAAGHCGKLAPSLIVICHPSSVSIKIRKDDTFGGTCSSEYVCMKRWREIEGERKSEYVCVCVCVRTSRATRPLRCHGNLYHRSTWG